MNAKIWLKKANIPDAKIILGSVLSLPPSEAQTFLVLHDDYELSEEELKLADKRLERRKKGEPLAYILGYREFYGRDFRVTPEVLIPRPETEEIVDFALKIIRGETGVEKIIDVGTGSGCIAISLALELEKQGRDFAITGVDISEKALAVAKRNAERLGAKNLSFSQSDLLNAVKIADFDLVIANLPYVSRDWEWTSPELKYEPEVALFAENEGLALIRRLLLQISAQISEQKPNKKQYLLLEADPCQHATIVEIAKKVGFSSPKTHDFVVYLEY